MLATGPAYSFEPERDVEDLARWLQQARAGALPGVDGGRTALLGGSYSGLHVQRLLRRPADLRGVRAVVLLGAPSDLFDARRRLEDGTYVPPFGLDAALVALGFPHREPLRYWRYSGAYHVRRDQPPLALIHSRQDEVVPFQQSEALARRLAAVGAPYRLDVFEAAEPLPALGGRRRPGHLPPDAGVRRPAAHPLSAAEPYRLIYLCSCRTSSAASFTVASTGTLPSRRKSLSTLGEMSRLRPRRACGTARSGGRSSSPPPRRTA